MGFLPRELLFGVSVLLVIFTEPCSSQRRGRLGAGASQSVDFDCPEEFGYYPHPSDCTQYYVCVFGGALLESCTGGLMYSHELQTCDWPRNVGCGESGESATISTVRVTDPRTRHTTPTGQVPSRAPVGASRSQVEQQQRQQQDEIAKHQLYADDLGPAEEIETDRQQRVYRGQPSTLGQVARDRDGLRHQPVTNAIPAPSGRVSSGDKVSVISFGSQQQPQHTQYSLDLLTRDNSLTNETSYRREKRQVRYRYPARVLQIVPTGVRSSWPTLPPSSVHSAGSGGNIKYQANLNQNKPPRLKNPMSPTDSGFQPISNPNIPQLDGRHFHSPDHLTHADFRPPPNIKFSNPDSNFGHHSGPSDSDLNFRTFTNPGSNTNIQPYNILDPTANSELIPNSYSNFQQLPSSNSNPSVPPSQFTAGSSVQKQTDDNFSFFNLGNSNPHSSPNYISTTPQIPSHSTAPTFPHFLTTDYIGLTGFNIQPTENSNRQNELQFLKSLTSVHELPYNEDRAHLYKVPSHHQQAVSSVLNPSQSLQHLPSPTVSSYPNVNNLKTHPEDDRGGEHHATHQESSTRQEMGHNPTITTTDTPFRPNTNPYGIENDGHSHRFTKPQINHSASQQRNTEQNERRRPHDERLNSHDGKERESQHRFAKVGGSTREPSKEYSSEEEDDEDYYDDEDGASNDEPVHNRFLPPSQRFHEDRFKNIENPFADLNFDFDKYIEKLRGNYQQVSQKQPDVQGSKDSVRGYNGRRPIDYEEYSEEEYDGYDDVQQEPSKELKHPPQRQPQHLPNSDYQDYTESIGQVGRKPDSSQTIRGGTTDKTKIRNHQPLLKPETLTAPFYHGEDGNYYARPTEATQTLMHEVNLVPEKSSPSTIQTTNLFIDMEVPNITISHLNHNYGKQTDKNSQNKYSIPSMQVYEDGRRNMSHTTRSTVDSDEQNSRFRDRTPSPPLRVPPSQPKPFVVAPTSTSHDDYYGDYGHSTEQQYRKSPGERSRNRFSHIDATPIYLIPDDSKVFTQGESVSNPNPEDWTKGRTTTNKNTDYSSTTNEISEQSSSTIPYPSKLPKSKWAENHNWEGTTDTTETKVFHSSINVPSKDGLIGNDDRFVSVTHSSEQSTLKQPITYYSGKNIGAIVVDNIRQTNNSSHANAQPHSITELETEQSLKNNHEGSSSSSVNKLQPSVRHFNSNYAHTKISSSTLNNQLSSTTLYDSQTQTTPETYTIRRRPSKDRSTTTPRHKIRRPTTTTPGTSNDVESYSTHPPTTLPRPLTSSSRRHRHPTIQTKSRTRVTTTERTRTSDMDSDRSESLDRPKSATSNRLDRKIPSDKQEGRTTNSIRVEPQSAPASYVQQPVVQTSPSPSLYNGSQQYNPAQYDPYYSIYDDDVELYRDVDYTQYTGNQGQSNTNSNSQQYRGQSPYKQQPQQPEVQQQRNAAYAQPSYNTQDVYTQSVGAQDYNENYNTPITDDQGQYRQQTASRQPSKSPVRGDRNELNFSHETTSTTIPTTTSVKTTTIRTTTTTSTVASTVPSSRQQTRHRGEVNSAATQQTTRTTTTQYDIPEEFQTLWNLPAQTSDPNPKPVARSPTNTRPTSDVGVRHTSSAQFQTPTSNARSVAPTPSASEPKHIARRITLTAALSLDDPYAADSRANQPSGRSQTASRRISVSAGDSDTRLNSRSGTAEIITLGASLSGNSKTNQSPSRTQSSPRRVSSKSFVVADTPKSSSRSLSQNAEVITIDDVSQAIRVVPSASSSENAARRIIVKSPNDDESNSSRGLSDSQIELINSAPRTAVRNSEIQRNQNSKLITESPPPRRGDDFRQSAPSRPLLKAVVEMDDFSDSDSESSSASRTLSRNSIAQAESTTSRPRSRGNSQPKPTPCTDEVDSNTNSDCTEKPQLRVRPTTASPDSQTTPGPARGGSSSRNRGSSPYTASGGETVNRGTPASVRSRPTLKPSTAIVSKAQDYIDIFKSVPGRPAPVYPTPQVDKTAAKCRKDVCLLPDCNCGGKDIPGDFTPEEIPQLVLLTFDDSANDLNKGLYSDLFEKGRNNPNGCPIAATFYVSHEWTDYSHVQNLYSAGHEIASHSISHSFGEQFSQKKWTREIGGQREILAAYGGVKLEDVRGMRAPFLAVGGNKMFKMLYDSNFTYDSSMPVYENKPPSWPYTLDYKIFHDCMIPPCPTRSYPGVWEVPMVMWQDLNGGRCSMGDACSNPPTADGVYKMLIKNFERHYTTNRAPFGLFYHAAWFTQPHHKEGFEAFLDTIVNMQDVWLVSNWQALQWVRDPTPLSRMSNFQPFQCNYPDRPRRCNNPKVCNLWHKSGVRYMRTCQPCPEIYPWTGKTGVRNSRVDNEIVEES